MQTCSNIWKKNTKKTYECRYIYESKPKLTVSAVEAEQCSLQKFASSFKTALPIKEEAEVDPHLSVLLELAYHCLVDLLGFLQTASKIHDEHNLYTQQITISSFKSSLKTYLVQQSYWLCVCLREGGRERERELVVYRKVWGFFFFPTYFVSCNGPCALKEKWHRKEHIIIIIMFLLQQLPYTGTQALGFQWQTPFASLMQQNQFSPPSSLSCAWSWPSKFVSVCVCVFTLESFVLCISLKKCEFLPFVTKHLCPCSRKQICINIKITFFSSC